MTALAPLLQGFFRVQLAQRRVSSNTVASYRDCFRLLLRFVAERSGQAPATLELADLSADVVGAFLDHLEVERHNGTSTRNLRLTAIHSLFSYAALCCPEDADVIARVLAIPSKRTDVTVVSFLSPPETAAFFAAPDRVTALGRRDHGCWSPRSRRDCGSPNSPPHAGATSPSGPGPTSTRWAKDDRSATPRSLRQQPGCCVRCS